MQSSWSQFLYAVGQDAAEKANTGVMPTYAVALPALSFSSSLIAAGFLATYYTQNTRVEKLENLLRSLARNRGKYVEFVIKKGNKLSTRIGIIKGIGIHNITGEECLEISYLNNTEEFREYIAHIPSNLLRCVKFVDNTPNIESRRRWLDSVVNLKGIKNLFQGNEEAAHSLAGEPHNICNLFDSAARIQSEAAEDIPLNKLIPSEKDKELIHLGDLVRLSESTKSAVARSYNTTINPRTNKHGAKIQIITGAIQSLKYDIFGPTGPVVFCLARTEPSFSDATSMINDSYIRRCRQRDLTISEHLHDLKPAGIDICAWYR